jgi:methyl-accepting chemotaxis protein
MDSPILHDNFKDVVRTAGLDREDVGALKRIAGKRMHKYINEYFLHLNGRVLSDLNISEGELTKLKDQQNQQWVESLSSRLPENFSSQSCAVGTAYARAGAPAFWHLTSYAWIIIRYIDTILIRYAFRPMKLRRVLKTFIMRMMYDMSCAIQGRQREADTQILRSVAGNVRDVNEVAVELTILAKNTRDVAASAATISAASSELVMSVTEISRNSEAAALEASGVDRNVASAAASVHKGADAMQNIATVMQEAGARVNELSNACEQIGEVLGFIENIAKQTNLLALNATIEAARAGEAGRGFRVVASEVKELAEQTAKATGDITQRITQLRSGMSGMLGVMKRSDAFVTEARGAIGEASGAMREILGQVAQVGKEMSDISDILRQQSVASSEVASNIEVVAGTAAENQRLLSGMASTLNCCTDRFAADAKDYFHADLDRALCEMAKVDHVLFKKRVVDALMGHSEWSIDAVPDHHNCRLGKWWDNVTGKAAELSSFKELEEPHARVHEAARRALKAYQEGHFNDAMAGLRDMNRASGDVIDKLDALSNAL